MGCVFCRIVAGEIPSNKVTESELCFAFRDLNPAAPTHVLIVPREHIANAGEISDVHGTVMAEMMVMAQSVADIDGIRASGYRLIFNVGTDSGNTVDHLHLHVLGGHSMGWPPFPNA
jgi:histidine triad (HIT) family protein